MSRTITAKKFVAFSVVSQLRHTRGNKRLRECVECVESGRNALSFSFLFCVPGARWRRDGWRRCASAGRRVSPPAVDMTPVDQPVVSSVHRLCCCISVCPRLGQSFSITQLVLCSFFHVVGINNICRAQLNRKCACMHPHHEDVRPRPTTPPPPPDRRHPSPPTPPRPTPPRRAPIHPPFSPRPPAPPHPSPPTPAAPATGSGSAPARSRPSSRRARRRRRRARRRAAAPPARGRCGRATPSRSASRRRGSR